MPDDDVQYLGTKPAINRPLPSHPFLNSSQRPVTGVTLCIEKAATEFDHGLVFRKAEEPIVHIGRRHGSDNGTGNKEGGNASQETGKAFFACPVVSRTHAKIAFSDSGHVYLIDLHSHHGTHLRRKGEIVSTQLIPETPTLLADGDVITFGKSVGAGEKGLVRPIVARVDLLYGFQPPLKPLVVPGPTEASPLRSGSSGRFGVHVPAASSSSDESSPDSDIEEIPGPSHVRPPWHDAGSDSTSPPQGGQKLCLAAPRPFSPFAMLQAFSAPMRSPSPNLFTRAFNAGCSDAYSHDVFENEDDDDDYSDNGNSNYSRSTSPMDLSSSPEPSDPPKNENVVAVGEPVIIGAWPHSRSSSPSPSVFTTSFPPIRIAASPVPATPVANGPEVVVVDLEPNVSLNEAVAEYNDESNKPAELSETAELKASLASVKTEVAKLHAHRRKYKQRFNDNLHVMGDKFSDLEDRTSEAHDLYNILSDRLEENVEACHHAQAQLDVLQDRLDTMADNASEEEMPPYAEEAKVSAAEAKARAAEANVSAAEASASVKALKADIAEMTVFRDQVRKEMTDQLKSIRETKATLKGVSEQLQVEAVSLKRKRSELEDNMTAAASPTVQVAEVVEMPARKRARRVVKLVAKTATAVTVGAVVTWSALAFS